ncbi:hypothetical protein LXL04_023483 [Taraxacum kok-saghyz]
MTGRLDYFCDFKPVSEGGYVTFGNHANGKIMGYRVLTNDYFTIRLISPTIIDRRYFGKRQFIRKANSERAARSSSEETTQQTKRKQKQLHDTERGNGLVLPITNTPFTSMIKPEIHINFNAFSNKIRVCESILEQPRIPMMPKTPQQTITNDSHSLVHILTVPESMGVSQNIFHLQEHFVVETAPLKD